jgi:spore coat protein U-like protein
VRRALLSLFLLLGLAGPPHGIALAQTCNVTVTGPLNFGLYTFTTPLDGVASLTLACRQINQAPGRIINYTIRLTSGPGSFVARQMQHLTLPGEVLRYNLFQDAARSLVWGDGTAGTVVVTGQFAFPPPNQETVPPIPIYGRIPADQNVVPGTYQTISPVTVIVEY